MIGPLGFATRSLRRRGFHALLAFLGLALTVASATFLLLLGEGLSANVNIESGPRATFGLAWLFYAYLLISLVFVLIVGLLSVSHLVSSMITQRMKDIAVVKAAGTIPRLLSSYALIEPFIVFLASCLTGAIAAQVTFISWSSSFQLNQTELFILLGVPGASFILSYLTARLQIRRILKTNTISGVTSQLSTLNLKTVGKPLRSQRLGFAFNLATRTLSRDRQFTRTALRIAICLFLSMVVLSGALVSWDTSKGYVEQAMPSHVLIIGTTPMVGQYVKLARSFSSLGAIPSLNYLNDSNLIGPELVASFRALQGVQAVDARLITVDNVTGYVKAHFASGGVLSGESTSPEIIPEAYTGSAKPLIVGINPNQTIPDWYSSDGFLLATGPENTMVAGEFLAGGIVQMPLNLSEIGWLGQRFNVKSIVTDPLNAGNVLYTPIQFVQQVFGTNGTNLLLAKTDGNPETVLRLQQFANQKGLTVASQDPILASNLAFLDNTWTYLLILPILTLALTSGILLSYLTSGFSRRFNDYVVLKVIGAHSRRTLGVLLWEGWGILVISLAIAIPLGLLFSAVLFIPESRVQPESLALSVVVSILALALVSVASAGVYSRKLRGTTVKDLGI